MLNHIRLESRGPSGPPEEPVPRGVLGGHGSDVAGVRRGRWLGVVVENLVSGEDDLNNITII